MDNSKRYYVYEWFVVETNEVFYVGKGSRYRYKTRKRENKFFTKMINTHNCDVRKVYDQLEENEAFEKEKELIAYYRKNTNYRLTNILEGGNQPPIYRGEESYSKIPSVREKISQSNKELWKDEEYRAKMSKAFKKFYSTEEGKRVSKERYSKIFDTEEKRVASIRKMKSTMRTEEFKNKHSETMKNAYSSESVREKVRGSNNGNSRKVVQYDIENNFIAEYETLMQVYETTRMSYKNISKALRGHRKTAYGYIWKYGDNKNITYSERGSYKNKTKRERKPILQYDLNGNFIAEFESVQEATEKNQLKNHSNIVCNLKGRSKTAYGYVWKYK